MKKKFDVSAIQNELEESAFFPGKRAAIPAPLSTFQEQATQAPVASVAEVTPAKPERKAPDTVIPRHHDTEADTMTPRCRKQRRQQRRPCMKSCAGQSNRSARNPRPSG